MDTLFPLLPFLAVLMVLMGSALRRPCRACGADADGGVATRPAVLKLVLAAVVALGLVFGMYMLVDTRDAPPVAPPAVPEE